MQITKFKDREGDRIVSLLVGILSRVDHKGLHHGEKQCSVCLFSTLHVSHQTTNHPKTTKPFLTQTYINKTYKNIENKIFEF